MRILVVRNDKLGDFMLTWPAFALIKQRHPDWHLTALVTTYTEPMARICPWIDDVLLDPGDSNGMRGYLTLYRQLRKQPYDALITLFSTTRIGLSGFLARIPFRLAPATKLAQIFYNHRLVQRRSRSQKPEFAYNLELAQYLLAELYPAQASTSNAKEVDADDYLPASIPRPLLAIDETARKKQRDEFCRKHGINRRSMLVFAHPGSGGSANNLSPEQYVTLLNTIRCKGEMTIVVTAGPGEEEIAQHIAEAIKGHASIALRPEGGLTSLTQNLSFCDLFISNSTGPLHIAGALNRNTATFYPRHRSGSPLRWQPLNAPNRQLIFTPPENAREMDVGAIDVILAATLISERFLLNDLLLNRQSGD